MLWRRLLIGATSLAGRESVIDSVYLDWPMRVSDAVTR